MSQYSFRHDGANGAYNSQGVKYFGGGSSKLGVDGLFRVKCDKFSIKSLDSTAEIQFSFDSTNWLDIGGPGGSLTIDIVTDRYYYRCLDATTWRPPFQVVANLREN